MAYRFRCDDASVEAGLRRIALEQIGRAIAEIDDAALDDAETVHQVRKRCKKLRGLIRLVRPAFDDYPFENAAFRDAAAELSFVRDAEVLLETFDALMETSKGRLERRARSEIRRRLVARKTPTGRTGDLEGLLASFRGAMAQAQARAAGWRLADDGFDVLGGGLGKTYRRARKAMAAAQADPTPDAVHGWRKRVKYHLYHTRLLESVWRSAMQARAKETERLGEMLGHHHDLAEFRKTVTKDPGLFDAAAARDNLLGLAAQRQSALEAQAFALGARLLAEPAGAIADRWAAWWTVWREEGSDP